MDGIMIYDNWYTMYVSFILSWHGNQGSSLNMHKPFCISSCSNFNVFISPVNQVGKVVCAINHLQFIYEEIFFPVGLMGWYLIISAKEVMFHLCSFVGFLKNIWMDFCEPFRDEWSPAKEQSNTFWEYTDVFVESGLFRRFL